MFEFLRRIWFRLDWKLDKLRARCQRFKRGYSYGDVWSMDYWFMSTVKPMLIHLRDYGISFPVGPSFTHQVDTENERGEWEAILTEMINCLDMMDDDKVQEHMGFGYFGAWNDMSSEDYKRLYEIREENKNRFFELFSEYFYDLWD